MNDGMGANRVKIAESPKPLEVQFLDQELLEELELNVASTYTNIARQMTSAEAAHNNTSLESQVCKIKIGELLGQSRI